MPFYKKSVGTKFRRRVQSVARPVRRGLRSRYVPKNKRGKRTANIGNIMRDITYIKRQLNTEWKNTGEITHGFETAAPPLQPTRQSPTFYALPYPATIGTSGVGDRIGKKVKICNMHMRWRLTLTTGTKPQTSNPLTPVYYKIYVVWQKDASPPGIALPDPLSLFKEDPTGNKSYISQFDELEYKNFLITYKRKGMMKFRTPVASDNFNKADEVMYMEHNVPLQIHQEFDDNNVLQTHRPWLLILTDNNDVSNEHIEFSLITKLSYVDN